MDYSETIRDYLKKRAQELLEDDLIEASIKLGAFPANFRWEVSTDYMRECINLRIWGPDGEGGEWCKKTMISNEFMYQKKFDAELLSQAMKKLAETGMDAKKAYEKVTVFLEGMPGLDGNGAVNQGESHVPLRMTRAGVASMEEWLEAGFDQDKMLKKLDLPYTVDQIKAHIEYIKKGNPSISDETIFVQILSICFKEVEIANDEAF